MTNFFQFETDHDNIKKMAAVIYDGVIYHTREFSPESANEPTHVVYNNRATFMLARVVGGRLTHVSIRQDGEMRSMRVTPARRYKIVIGGCVIMTTAAAAIISAGGYYSNMLACVIGTLALFAALMTLYITVMIMRRVRAC
jgi:hypothetical protein